MLGSFAIIAVQAFPFMDWRTYYWRFIEIFGIARLQVDEDKLMQQAFIDLTKYLKYLKILHMEQT